jgi:molecular chaperone GrpE
MRPDEEGQGPVIRDRRRIDPSTGQVRDPGESGPRRGPAQATGQVRDAGEPGPPRGPAQAGAQPRPGRHSVSRPGGATASSGPGPQADGDRAASSGREPDERPGSAGSAASSEPAAAPGAARDAAAAQAVAKLAERTADLQRLQAEYANYRKRVERDRLAVREQALANVLNELVPVLDDIGRAREHGELTGGFKSVGESLEGIAFKLGLTPFGESGDPFDPTLHEALLHSYSADVTEPTAVQILQPGYKVGERIIRPARVAVAEPGGDTPEQAGTEQAAAASAEEDETSEGGDTSASDGTGER